MDSCPFCGTEGFSFLAEKDYWTCGTKVGAKKLVHRSFKCVGLEIANLQKNTKDLEVEKNRWWNTAIERQVTINQHTTTCTDIREACAKVAFPGGECGEETEYGKGWDAACRDRAAAIRKMII